MPVVFSNSKEVDDFRICSFKIGICSFKIVPSCHIKLVSVLAAEP